MNGAPMHELLTGAERRTVVRALQILERYIVSTGATMTSPDAVRDYLRLAYVGEARERFRVLFLNAQGQLIASEELSIGTLSQTVVYPREVARRALLNNARAVILVHNHPSGSAEPSVADDRLTEAIRDALGTVGVDLHDHFIVAGRNMVSMEEWRLVRKAERQRAKRLAGSIGASMRREPSTEGSPV